MWCRHVPGVLVIGFAVATLAGCGGGSSPSGASGGGGGHATAVVQGEVRSSRSAATGESRVVLVLQRIAGVGIAEAASHDTPIEGATVVLTCGAYTATQTTDEHGQFVFRNVPFGDCQIQVVVGGVVVATTDLTVGAGDKAVVGVVTGTPPNVQVVAESTDVLNNEAQLGHAANIANASATCDIVDVTRLREQGNGWGRIAHRCGVHPGVIGLGRSNLSDGDLADAGDRIKNGRRGGNGKDKGGQGKGRGPKST